MGRKVGGGQWGRGTVGDGTVGTEHMGRDSGDSGDGTVGTERKRRDGQWGQSISITTTIRRGRPSVGDRALHKVAATDFGCDERFMRLLKLDASLLVHPTSPGRDSGDRAY